MDVRLDFESSMLVQDLLSGDTMNLAEAADRLGVEAMMREGWVRLVGPEAAVVAARSFFVELEQLIREGGSVQRHDFQLVLDNASSKLVGRPAETSLEDELARYRILDQEGRTGVSPKSRNQMEFVQAMKRSHVVFGFGPAGTGKTFLSMAFALHQLLEGRVRRIVLTRPAFDLGRGGRAFVSTDARESAQPYLRPLYDAMHDLGGPGEAGKLLAKNAIEVAPLAFMSGRTIKDSIVILDEAQSTSAEEMLMFLTRLGEGSQAIVIGDPAQLDTKERSSSGLLEARRVLHKCEGVEFIELNQADVVRNLIVQRIVRAYERYREEEIK